MTQEPQKTLEDELIESVKEFVPDADLDTEVSPTDVNGLLDVVDRLIKDRDQLLAERDEVASRLRELMESNDELKDSEDRRLRLLAEFDNYRNRVDAEREQLETKLTHRGILPQLVDLFDAIALSRRYSAEPQNSDAVESISKVAAQSLKSLGVLVVDQVNGELDLRVTEVASALPDGVEGIPQVIRQGYLLKVDDDYPGAFPWDESTVVLIRPMQVIITPAPEKE